MSHLRISLIIAVATSLSVSVLQHHNGSLDSDLGGDPDEAAHAVTSLMLRDYCLSGLKEFPLKFATDYYHSFPKVALGHYPPLYYAVSSIPLWFWPQTSTLVHLQALWCGLIAATSFLLARRLLPLGFAVGAGLLTAFIPLTLRLSQDVMADLLLTFLCSAAILAWLEYVHRERLRTSVLFGILASLALLTKGTAALLAGVPLFVTMLTANWRQLRCPQWWAAAVPVMLLAAPWYAYSARITKEGMMDMNATEFFPVAWSYYLSKTPEVFGLPLTLAVGGLVLTRVFTRVKGQPLPITEALLWAWLVCGALVITLVPAGLTTRYLMIIVPPFVLLSLCAVRLATRGLRKTGAIVHLLWILLAVAWLDYPPSKMVSGYGSATIPMVRNVVSSGTGTTSWLVCSDPRGEGALIAEVAFALPSRDPSPIRVCRASKVLASSDWMGRGYAPRFQGTREVLQFLETEDISKVFIDESVPDVWKKQHHSTLKQALEGSPHDWNLFKIQKVVRKLGDQGEMLVFTRRQAPS